MWPRLSIVLGLVAGVAAGALILGALLFLTPDPGSGATPTPSPSAPPSAPPSVPPSAVPSATPSPSATATPGASSGASPGPSVSPSSSAAAARFHIGEPPPDVMARGVSAILTGVEVTP
jgi:hypothetical protein